MLDGLKLWHDVVDDGVFVKALGELADEGSEATRLSCGVLRGVVAKDFKEAARCFASLLTTEIPEVKNGDLIIQVLMQECLKAHWRSDSWDRFATTVSSTVSSIITKLQENNLNHNERITKIYHDSAEYSLIDYTLYDWMARLNHNYLYIQVSPQIESLRKIKCFYDINSFIELLFVGSKEYLAKLTFNDL